MNVLIIGSGGREHALAWKIKQSPRVQKIYCAPGNGGISQIVECIDIKADDITALADFAAARSVDLTIVGPEAPLVAGISDEFQRRGLTAFGPSREAAQLEGSKVFAKEFMRRHGIPTASFESFSDFTKARAHLARCSYPLVVKADGLAAGKGVIICLSEKEAVAALERIMKQRVFRDAGNSVVIEECLVGEEASILAISDGTQYVVLESSQDHKRIFDGDLGPNTGGMGAYSPAPVVTPALQERIAADIIRPTIDGMKGAGTPLTGVLYVGLMITEHGPRVLEYNVRFGDPETQALLPRLKTDLVDVMLASCHGTIDTIALDWDVRACVCVVMSARGYPGEYEKGKKISGLESIADDGTAIVFHAGTKCEGGSIMTTGGRVLGVSGLGQGIEQALRYAYTAVESITFDGRHVRKDIGQKALTRSGV